MERLQHEFAAVGFYLSGHPLDEYAAVLTKLGVQRYADFEQKAGFGTSAARLAAIVVSARERRSQKGNKFAFAAFSDATGQFEAVIFSDTLARSRDLLEPGTAVLISIEAEREGDTLKMRVQSLERLDEAAANVQRGLEVVLDARALMGRQTRIDEIKALLKPGPAGAKGGTAVHLTVEVAGATGVTGARSIKYALPGRYDISAHDRGELSTVAGVLEVIDI